MLQALVQLAVVELAHLLPREEMVVLAQGQTRLAGDGAGGSRVVAGEHNHANPGLVAPVYGPGDPRPQGVADPQETQSDKPAWISDRSSRRPLGDHQNP